MLKLKKTEMMKRVGAKLTNDRWGWDGVMADGSVVFIGWEDQTSRTPAGELESCIVWEDGNRANERLGGQERKRHIDHILKCVSVGYLVIATAEDLEASPRQISGVDENLYSVRLDRRGPAVFAVRVALNSAPAITGSDGDDAAIAEIRSDDRIPETDKQQLIQARRGQGLFRTRVELLEAGCRVTGVNDRAHLRAGHIKPWRNSTNMERLDGNNGLLLAPHIDHLFDRGFISFEDDGRMLVSSRLKVDVLRAWGIEQSAECGTFNTQQCTYLAFHRTKVFL